MSATPSMLCERCGTLFYRRPHRSEEQWAARRFCSRACFWAARTARAISTVSTRACAECGSVFTSQGHSAARWLSRRFCSRKCADKTRSREYRAALPDIKTAFESRIEKTDGCWLWRGAQDGHGYGLFIYIKRYRAHILALALDGRPVPKGRIGCHHCDNPLCVRPSHLYVGTVKMNNDDAWRRSRIDHGIRHSRAKLTPEDVLEMRRTRGQGVSFRRIARAFNISAPAATNAVLGRTWKRDAPSNADDLARLKKIGPQVSTKTRATIRARRARLKATAEAPHRRHSHWEYPFDRREYLSLFPRVPPPACHHG
jgi:hypothetical protein